MKYLKKEKRKTTIIYRRIKNANKCNERDDVM